MGRLTKGVTRSQLYEQGLHHLLGQPPDGAGPFDSQRAAEWWWLLAEVAYTFFDQAPGAPLGTARLLRCLANSRYLIRPLITVPGASPLERASLLLDELRQKRILVPQDSRRTAYAFPDRSLTEFLAAVHLANRVEDQGWHEVEELIQARSWLPAWQEVIVFLAGRLSRFARAPRTGEPAHVGLLRLLANADRDDQFRHRLALAAHCLSEVSDDDAPRRGPSLRDDVTTAVWRLWRASGRIGHGSGLSSPEPKPPSAGTHQGTHPGRRILELAWRRVASRQSTGAAGGTAPGQCGRSYPVPARRAGRPGAAHPADPADPGGAGSADHRHASGPDADPSAACGTSRRPAGGPNGDGRNPGHPGFGRGAGVRGEGAAEPDAGREGFGARRDLADRAGLARAADQPAFLRGLLHLLASNLPHAVAVRAAAVATVWSLGHAAAAPEFRTGLAALLRRADGGVRASATLAALGLGRTANHSDLVGLLLPPLDPPEPVIICFASFLHLVEDASPTLGLSPSDGTRRVGELAAAVATPAIFDALARALASADELFAPPAVGVVRSLRIGAGGPHFVEQLTAALAVVTEDGPRSALLVALATTGELAATSAVLHLLPKLLCDVSSEVRRAAAAVVQGIGRHALREDILDGLARLLHSSRDDQQAATQAVATLGPAAGRSSIRDGLASLLTRGDAAGQLTALMALRGLGTSAGREDVLRALAKLLAGTNDAAVCFAAAAVVRGLGARAVRDDLLVALDIQLGHDNQSVRAAIAAALGALAASWRDNRSTSAAASSSGSPRQRQACRPGRGLDSGLQARPQRRRWSWSGWSSACGPRRCRWSARRRPRHGPVHDPGTTLFPSGRRPQLQGPLAGPARGTTRHHASSSLIRNSDNDHEHGPPREGTDPRLQAARTSRQRRLRQGLEGRGDRRPAQGRQTHLRHPECQRPPRLG